MLTNYFGQVNIITRFGFIRNNIFKGRNTTFQKEEKMENETLFNEEEEPPGPPPGLVKLQNNVTDFFSLGLETHQPYLAKQKPQRLLFPFKDSPRSRIFRQRHYPDISRFEWFDWHWSASPGYTDRVIIPFYHNNKIVGWTGRKITDGKPKYLTDAQPGYVFNIDAQTPDRQ